MRYGQLWIMVLCFMAVLFIGCVIEEDGGCWDDEDCYYSEYCGSDGWCHDRDGSDDDYEYYEDEETACWDDWDCPGDTICEDGYCWEPDVEDDGGCYSDEDCPSDSICNMDTGGCFVPECVSRLDCPTGFDCDSDHQCVAAGQCRNDADCGGGPGMYCLSRRCYTRH